MANRNYPALTGLPAANVCSLPPFAKPWRVAACGRGSPESDALSLVKTRWLRLVSPFLPPFCWRCGSTWRQSRAGLPCSPPRSSVWTTCKNGVKPGAKAV